MHRRAYALLLATTLFWGGNAVAGKLAVGHISPMVLTTSRWALACVILLAFGWPRLRADWPVLRPRLGLLFALGTVGFTGFNVALYAGLIFTSAINISIEQAGVPMLIFLLNFLFFGQAARPMQIVGLVLSVLGIALTASHGDPASLLSLDLNLGDAMMLGGIVAYAAYTVALRYRPPAHWISNMIALCAAGFVSSLFCLAVEHALGAVVLPDQRGWAILAYVVIFPSILSQIFYIWGVELIGGNRAGLFINLVPIFGTLLSIAVLGEDFHPYHALALALVMGGIGLAEASGRRGA